MTWDDTGFGSLNYAHVIAAYEVAGAAAAGPVPGSLALMGMGI
jgi:hypothetical protein